jgi:hypothetical protein
VTPNNPLAPIPIVTLTHYARKRKRNANANANATRDVVVVVVVVVGPMVVAKQVQDRGEAPLQAAGYCA